MTMPAEWSVGRLLLGGAVELLGVITKSAMLGKAGLLILMSAVSGDTSKETEVDKPAEGAADQPGPKSAADKAKELGYDRLVKDPPFNPHGQKVFTNGNDFITPDVDQHNGGEWKGFDRRGTRTGTYDADLNWIGK